MPHDEPFRLNLVGFRPLKQNTLRGFATVVIEPLGLQIEDAPVHCPDSGEPYALLPGRPRIDADGVALRQPNGKVAYQAVMKFADRERRERFSRAVIALVKRSHPETLS